MSDLVKPPKTGFIATQLNLRVAAVWGGGCGQVLLLVVSRGGGDNVFSFSLEGVRQNLGNESRSQPPPPPPDT